MPELGESGDPVALLPGDPAALHETAWAMAGYAETLAEAATGLGRISTVDGWSGAAADGFRADLVPQASRWRDAADAFRAAGTAVEDHAVALESAQRGAADAAALWAGAQQATEQARAAAASVAGPVVDPGEAGRRRAVEVLGAARASVGESGDRAAAAVEAARDRAPAGPGFWSEVGATASWIAASAGNSAASMGNAALHHPGSGIAVIGGAGLAAVSAAGFVGSLAADATVVLAPVGIPAGAVSAAGAATGFALGTGGAIDLALNAAGPDRVQPFQVAEDTAPPAEPPPFDPPREITGFTKHGELRAQGRDGGHGVSDEATERAVTAPTSEPAYDPARRTYRYEGEDAVVFLNEQGQVVTAWPTHRTAYRNP